MAIPGVGEECFHEPTNNQFVYETTESLELILQKEYGSVSIIRPLQIDQLFLGRHLPKISRIHTKILSLNQKEILIKHMVLRSGHFS